MRLRSLGSRCGAAHMMEDVLAGPQPWRFGHLLLPGGSTSLGSSDYALRPRTRAPLVGTLLEVRCCSVKCSPARAVPRPCQSDVSA